ncbi:MAG: DUF1552 domain-containing protein [Myxococcota bacterium]
MKSPSTRSRRRFMQALGLGAGASLLAPISKRLLTRALGMDEVPKKRLIVMSVYMLEPSNYVPVERGNYQEVTAPTVVDAWPEVFSPLGEYMQQAVFIDGSRNHIGTHQHRSGTAALSCVRQTDGRPERMGPAGAATIDQYIAETLSAESPHKSVLWGITGDAIDGGRETASGVFAAGREANLSHHTHARSMMDALFPDPADAGEMPADTNGFRPIRDRLLEDLARLRARLAPEERIALESYEEAIVEFDRRQEARSRVSCASPGMAPEDPDAQAHFESMCDQSMLALRCGLTNVIGATIGTSGSHNKHMAAYREMHERTSSPTGEARFFGHGAASNLELAMEARRHWHQVHFRNLARIMDGLRDVPEDDGRSLFDHTAVLYVTGNGHTNAGHHAGAGSKDLWPALIIGGAETGFQTGSRYMSCSHHEVRGERWDLSNVYRTLAEGLGVDSGGFGEEPVQLFESVLA